MKDKVTIELTQKELWLVKVMISHELEREKKDRKLFQDDKEMTEIIENKIKKIDSLNKKIEEVEKQVWK